MTKVLREMFRLAWLPLVAAPAYVQGQALTLFEPTENTGAAQEVNAPAPGFVVPGNGQPAFTLRSTSRIGDSYHVVLINRDGSVAKVEWQAGQSATVPGHGGFAITEVAGRAVTLTQPEACVSAPDKGVSCGTDNQALLALATAAPAAAQAQMQTLAGPNPQDPFAAAAAAAAQNGGVPPNLGIRGVPGGQVVEMGNGQTVVINPFTGQPETVPQLSAEEQAMRMDRQRQRTERLRQFQARRIDDADIPEGMQRVRTPFGDQLVPAQ